MKCWRCHRREYLFKCWRCGKYFCSEHRLPEDHNCRILEEYKKKNKERWKNVIKEELGYNNYSTKSMKEDSSYPVEKISKKIEEKHHSKPKKRIPFFKYLIIAIGILLLFFVISHREGINIFEPRLNCSEGTKYDSCSLNKPFYCFNGTLINKSSECGCPYDYRRDNESCKKILRCSDGTEYEKCASNKPLYCSKGKLINKSSICGCPYDLIQQNEICVSKYQIGPKDITLKYLIKGREGTISYEVYLGLNDYLSDLSRSISYYYNEPTTKDFIIRDLDNEHQREFLLPLVNEIESKTENTDDQVRIAISIVQNIPYDWSLSLDGRYPYEVLYDMEGVCGEKSELLVFLLRELGYGTVVFEYDQDSHRAVGIKCPLQYSYYKTGYCFIESTSPGIITDSEGDYLGVGKLGSPEVIYINEGKSFDSVSEEYNDALEWNRINGLGQYLDSGDYSKWESLVKKYGITFDE